MTKPYELVIVRNELYDPASKSFKSASIPTSAVRRAKRRGTASAQSLFGSYYPGAGSVLQVNRLRCDSTPNMEFIVHSSQAGTLDVIYGATESFAVDKPLYACKGTFKVVALGSATQGTYFAGFGGVVE